MCDSMPSHNPGGKATLGQGLDQQVALTPSNPLCMLTITDLSHNSQVQGRGRPIQSPAETLGTAHLPAYPQIQLKFSKEKQEAIGI